MASNQPENPESRYHQTHCSLCQRGHCSEQSIINLPRVFIRDHNWVAISEISTFPQTPRPGASARHGVPGPRQLKRNSPLTVGTPFIASVEVCSGPFRPLLYHAHHGSKPSAAVTAGGRQYFSRLRGHSRRVRKAPASQLKYARCIHGSMCKPCRPKLKVQISTPC